MFAVLFADSFMAYGFPIVIEGAVNNPASMGLILAFSSMVGVVFDLLVPRLFGDRSWQRILFTGILVGMLFPILVFLGISQQIVLLLFIASAAWGIYYELILFASQDFISNEESAKLQDRDWSIFAIIWHIAILLAPIIASRFIDTSYQAFTTFGLILYAIALGLFWLVLARKRSLAKLKPLLPPIYSFKKQLKYLSGLFFYFIISITVTLLTALHWGFGGLYGEELMIQNVPSWLIFTGFSGGLLLGSLIKLRFHIPATKKSLAVIMCLSGICLALTSVVSDAILIALLIMASTTFLAITEILLATIFSRQGELAKQDEIYALNIERLGISIGFIIFPIVLGLVSENIGYGKTFSLAGIAVTIIALVCGVYAIYKRQ